MYLTVIVIIALALGALLRRTSSRGSPPTCPNAGGVLWGDPLSTTHALSPWTGFAVLCGYAVALTGLAAWRLRRRDA